MVIKPVFDGLKSHLEAAGFRVIVFGESGSDHLGTDTIGLALSSAARWEDMTQAGDAPIGLIMTISVMLPVFPTDRDKLQKLENLILALHSYNYNGWPLRVQSVTLQESERGGHYLWIIDSEISVPVV